MDPILGTITIFAGNFAPRGWAFCDGSLLSIQQNTALFSLLGIQYGGDGIQTFALPDLRGRVPLHVGAGTPGAGLSPYFVGQSGGTETVTLTQAQMPMHSHAFNYSSNGPDGEGSGTSLASGNLFNSAAANVSLGPQTIGAAGGNQPHSNLQPYLGLNFIIATEGVYPSRN